MQAAGGMSIPVLLHGIAVRRAAGEMSIPALLHGIAVRRAAGEMSISILLHGIAAMRATGLRRARWEFWEFWEFWEIARDCTAVGRIYALTREMSIVHESGRSISSADSCLTVLFFKLPTILNPLNFLTSVSLCRIVGQVRQVRDSSLFPTSYNWYYIILKILFFQN